MAKILIVDDEPMMRDGAARTLAARGHSVTCCRDAAAALRRLEAGPADLLLTDLRMPRMTGIELLHEARRLRPGMPVVLMTAYATVATAVSALKQGAADYLQKPFDGEELTRVVTKALAAGTPGGNVENAARLRPMIGDSPAMKALRRQIVAVAPSRATVLVKGESGVGKEVVARAIHAAGDRADRPVVAVNCAALSPELLERELFGHEAGVVGGDPEAKPGRFERADGGTLLLDEVGEIDPAVQGKLLRVLADGQFERLGGGQTRRADVRVIATTSRDLAAAVADGAFRDDLYYRLNVLPVEVPPLRGRAEDVPALARHVLARIGRRDGSGPRELEPAALALLARHDWPGNVRELENLLERAACMEAGDGPVTARTLAAWLQPARPEAVAAQADEAGYTGEPLAEVEKRVILAALEKYDGHRVRTAKALGIGVRTLGMKLKKWREEGELLPVA